MRKVLENNSVRLIMALLALALSADAKAQIIDWIGNQIKGYIEDQVNSITHSNQGYLGSFGTMLWDSIVESKAEDDVKEEAMKLRDLDIDKGEYNKVDSKYGMTQSDINYRNIYYRQSDLTKSFIYSEKQLPLNTLGGGQILKSITEYSDSAKKASVIKDLSFVLTPAAIEELNPILEKNDSTLLNILLQDINENKSLSFVFNNHRGSINIYANSLSSSLRKKTSHLIYWSAKATACRKHFPKKAQPINSELVKFVDRAQDADIMYNDNVIGVVDGDMVDCKTIDLMNLNAMPNAHYKFNTIDYYTDELGRVSKVSQLIKKDSRKCPAKSKFKAKYLMTILSKDKNSKPYALAVEKYGAPVTQINTLFFENSKDNKNAQKNMMKAIKKALKSDSNVTVVTQIKYADGSPIPNDATITVGYNLQPYILTNSIFR